MTQGTSAMASMDDVEGKVEAMNAGKLFDGPSFVEQRQSNVFEVDINKDSSTGTQDDTPFNPDNLTNPDLCIGEMNKRYAVVNAGNKVQVIDEYADAMLFLAKETFLDLYLNVTVRVNDRSMPVGAYWFKHPDRRQYVDGVVFDPCGGASSRKYNLWKGFAVTPDANKSCERMLDHLEHVICDGDSQCFEYLMNWLALLVQKPGQLPGVAICLLSGQGTGKGVAMDYLGKMLGKHFKPITNKEQLLGKFTGHLEDAVLVFADELHWEGNKAETGMIKGLITEPTRMMERKYSAPISVKNCVHLMIASNEHWAVPAELSDRRFFVLQVASTRQGDSQYFKEFVSEMNGGGPEALLAALQDRDITSFDPSKFPKTSARVSQQLASLAPIERWLYEIADVGEASAIDRTITGEWPERITKQAMLDAYSQWRASRRLGGVVESTAKFTSTLKRFGFKPGKVAKQVGKGRAPGYQIPRVANLRAAIDEALGHPAPWDSG